MGAKESKLSVTISAIIGAIAGFVVLHTYAMIAYALHERREVINDLMQAATFSFEPDMLSMGVPFTLFGALAGLFFGLWSENRKRKAECEKRLVRWISREGL